MAKYQTNFTGDESIDFGGADDASKAQNKDSKRDDKKRDLSPEDQKKVEGIDAGLEGDTPAADDKAEEKVEEKKPAAKRAPAKKTAAKKADDDKSE